MQYNDRFTDGLLCERLESAGAVLIEGVKGCGKTETAKRHSTSFAWFDADEQIRMLTNRYE